MRTPATDGVTVFRRIVPSLGVILTAVVLLTGCQLLPDKQSPRVDLDVAADQVNLIPDPETGVAVLEVRVEASDDRALDEVWIEVDGERYDDSLESGVDDLQFEDDFVIELEPGEHEIEAVATDAAGNEDRSRAQGVVVAETPAAPQLTQEQLQPGELPEGHPDIAGMNGVSVAAGRTPREHVEAYGRALVAGDYDTAYTLLPPSTAVNYGSAEAFGQQIAGYGITGWSIGTEETSDGAVSIVGALETQNMDISYVWRFLRSGEGWTCVSREMDGS